MKILRKTILILISSLVLFLSEPASAKFSNLLSLKIIDETRLQFVFDNTPKTHIQISATKLIINMDLATHTLLKKQYQSAFIKAVRWGLHPNDSLRVVIEFNNVQGYKQKSTANGFDIIFQPSKPSTNTFLGNVQAIPKTIQQRMIGKSWKKNCPVPLQKLAYLQLPYWGFDGNIHMGELIVHHSIAKEVLAIFADIFKAKFPIQQMALIEKYNASDTLSMAANNTSAFNCRPKIGQNKGFSKHSYGTAIDINPLLNPYVQGTNVFPKEAQAFINRQQQRAGFIKKGEPLHRAFIKRGWRWGGSWKRVKDYQHFDRNIR